ncbi:hypothetical protein FPOAC2_05375 [Fusarium poae]|uniref:Peptidase A1 domain-containing protein n=1 Tax=Fusarium poae TaxID=36050 RepID=A0A1B8AUN9_FUSPO|nr:hypothetical protein FPOAC1_005268 [Fusarium poae]KAG8672009.1 hypothetical protein FPOAC1_005268 [Fusarium poae]OBS24225.1 hypothetical protein FPOA_04772 [Fusarium poae]
MTVTRFASALLASSVMGLASADVLDMPIIVKQGYKMVEFGIGTPAQTARLLFDTGSASAWMVDAECAETCPHVNQGTRNGYNLTESSTGKKTGHSANIDYLGGKIVGPTVQDKFTAGGLKWDSKFIAANDSTWSSLAADGFMGLGFGSIQDGDATPVFESMMEQKLMDKPRFGIYYGGEKDTGDKPGKGVLTLGGSREDKYVEGDLITVPLVANNGEYDLWRSIIHSTTGKQDKTKNTTDQNEKRTEMNGMSIIFDTGASGITFPESMINDIYESIGMNYTAILKGEHLPLCSEFTKDWSVTFEIGYYGDEKNVTIRGDQLRRPGFAEREDACWPPFQDGPEGYALIGTLFLTNFYTIWDYSLFPGEDGFMNPQLSFGYLKESV